MENGIVRDATTLEIAQREIDDLENSKTEYAKKRKNEYPAAADYLDGIVKGDQAQIQAYIDACLAVKTKYPKS